MISKDYIKNEVLQELVNDSDFRKKFIVALLESDKEIKKYIKQKINEDE